MYSHESVEKEVQGHWKEKKVPEKIVKMEWKKPKFYLLDGPPYVNGIPHVGNVMTTIFKDVWGKFKHMQGFSVWFQPGFDCGGLPIENKVEQKLGIITKTEIVEKIGVDKFIHECKKFAEGNEKLWLDFYNSLGAWRGWFRPIYRTSDNYYLESGWWTIKQWYDKGFFVEGKKPGFWCTRCETVLAGIEASESYKNLTDPSIFVKFPIKGKRKEYLLVWTTTPWTLPSNVALAVHPDKNYVKVGVNKEKLILAEERLEIFEEIGLEYKILERFKGRELGGIKYSTILEIPVQKELGKDENCHKVYLSIPIMKKRVASKSRVKNEISEEKDQFGHIVTMDAGSGIVHIAPGHGEVDNRLGKHYNLPEISPVNEKGELTNETGEFSGIYVKEADELIIKKLQKTGKLLFEGKITHSYPLCWRCKTPLIYRMSKQWFLKMDTLKEKIIKANKKVNWLPEFAGDRYHNTISEAPDWAVTRQRFWGIPLPLWICGKCGKQMMIGSREELRKYSIVKLPKDFDLHKNFVDNVKLKCNCGGKMSRDNDIMDVWFDSGIAPWASLGYPFKNKDIFEKLWKVDLVDESQDQIKSWFNTLMICGMATFNESPYKTVCMNGWVLDEKGEKMSKSLGNVVYGEQAYNELGADLLRLYICSDISPWETHKFSMNDAKSLHRIFNTIHNVSQFIKMYKIDFASASEIKEVENKWILSRINSVTSDVNDDLKNFRFHLAGRKLIDFILGDFSRVYLKLAKDKTELDETKFTVHKVFSTYLKLLAPICPFITESLYVKHYSQFEKQVSIHMSRFPDAEKQFLNKELEENMDIMDNMVETVNSLRQENNLRLRWPLKEVRVFGRASVKRSIGQFQKLIQKLTNVKEVKFDERIKIKTEIKPHYREFGRKFGKHVREIVSILEKKSPEELIEKLNKGSVKLGKFEINKEMLVISERVEKLPKNFVGKSFKQGVVVINLERDKYLEEEAVIRELLRKIQVERKNSGLKIDEKINLKLSDNNVLKNWEKLIMKNLVVNKLVFTNKKLKHVCVIDNFQLGFEISKM